MRIIRVLLLFAFVQQIKASKRREKESRTLNVLKKGAPLLALLYGTNTQNEHFTARSFVHPKTQNCDVFEPVVEEPINTQCSTFPQRNAVELMNYVRCYQDQEPDFQQYLMNVDDCESMKSIYEKAQELGTCVMNAPKAILQGVKSYLTGKPEFGQTFSAISYEMLSAHLKTLEQNFEIDANGAQRLIEKAGKRDDLDFIQVKRAAEFLQKNSNHSPEEAFEEALDSKYQNYDFDKVEKMLTYTTIWFPDAEHLAATEALASDYQNYDFDKVEQMMKIAKIMYPNSEYDASREAMQKWYWDLDLSDTELVLKTVLAQKFEYEDFERVEELIKLLKKIFNTEERVYEEIFKNGYKLKELSLREISTTIEDCLLGLDPEIIFWGQIDIKITDLQIKEGKKREDL